MPRGPRHAARDTLPDRYRLLRPAGKGRFAEVFRVRDRLLGRDLALKRFRPSQGGAWERMLEDEFLVLSGLAHPNLPRVHDFGVDARWRPFFTMDFLEGPTLAQVLERAAGRAPAASRAAFAAQLAGRALSALAHMHARGVVHGDVKPANVMFASRGRGGLPPADSLRLVDFGLAGTISTIKGEPARGTPRYMAPEVMAGGIPDDVSDLYSLGLLLVEALAALGLEGGEAGPIGIGLMGFGRRLADAQRGCRYRSADEAMGELLALLAESRDRSAAGLRKLYAFTALPRSWEGPVAALEARLAEARAGRGGVVVAEGLGGRAADRVVSVLRARALVSGMAAMGVTVDPSSPGDPVAAALAQEAARASGRTGTAAAGGTPDPGPGDGRSRRRTEAPAGLGSLLETARDRLGGAGTAVFVTGAERLAPDQLGVLGHLALMLRRKPILVVVAGARARTPSRAAEAAPVESAVFPELDQGAVEDLLVAAFGAVHPREILARLVAEASGGEMEVLAPIVEEMVRRGALVRARSGWIADVALARSVCARPPAARPALPILPASIRARARILGVLGREFDEGLAGAVLDLRPDAVGRLLAALRAAGYLREAAEASEGRLWRFASPSLARDLAAELPAASLRAVHRRALRHLDRSARPAPASRRARHLAGIGDVVAAARAWLESGRGRMARHDLLGACGDLERALDLAAGADARLELEVRLRLAEALQAAGHAEPSLAHLEEVLDAGPGSLPGGTDRIDLALLQARNLELLDRRGESRQLLLSAIEELPPWDRRRRALVVRALGWLAFLDGDQVEARSRSEAARTEAEASKDPVALAAARSLSGHLLRAAGSPEEAEAEFRGAVALLEEAGEEARAANELHNLATTWFRKDTARARELYLEAEREISRIGLEYLLAALNMNLAIVERGLGDWESAERRYRSSIDLAARLGADLLQRACMNLGTLLMDRGAFEEAAACLDRASALLAGRPRSLSALNVELNRARLEIRQGRPEAALALLEAAAPDLSPAHPNSWVNLHNYRAEVLATLGRIAEAERAAETARAAAWGQQDETLRGEALLYGAAVERAAGRREEALRSLQSAEAIFVKGGQIFYAARVRLERARALAADPGSAGEALEDAAGAARAFERLGARPFMFHALELKRRLEEALRRSLDAPLELKALYEISELTEKQGDLEALLQGLLEAVIRLLGAERGMIYLVSEGEGGGLQRAAHRGLRPDEEADVLRVSRGILDRALHDDAPLLSHDAVLDARFRSLESVVRYQIHSVLCAPLRHRNQVLGTIYVDHAEMNRFSERDARFLRALAGFAAPVILAERGRRRLAGEVAKLSEEIGQLRRGVEDGSRLESILGASAAARKVRDLVERCASSDANVLIVGETGTGKELAARVIHNIGPRAGGRFVAVNGATLGGSLADSLLFGHRKGAFTDAVADRAGCFEMAHGGTLFFDEVDSLPPDAQSKLLRVVESGEVTPLGSKDEIKVDVRLLAAASRDLRALVESGQFRPDLRFRLTVLTIEIPPLRERPEDIEPLLRRFIERECARRRRPRMVVAAEVLEEYLKYPWPGNVRELQNCVEKAVILATGDALPPLHEILEGGFERYVEMMAAASAQREESLKNLMARYVQLVYERVGRNAKEACRVLRINFRTLKRYLDMKVPPLE